jgi:predicted RNA binding protein with dsRBD fold (UPF0201 family)
MSQVYITCPTNSTEDLEKVCSAITNLFPDAQILEKEKCIEAETTDLALFIERLRDQKIRDTARHVLSKSITGDKLEFHLNKQAAFVSKINFTDGDSVLGDILITVTDNDIMSVVEHMTQTHKSTEESI